VGAVEKPKRKDRRWAPRTDHPRPVRLGRRSPARHCWRSVRPDPGRSPVRSDDLVGGCRQSPGGPYKRPRASTVSSSAARRGREPQGLAVPACRLDPASEPDHRRPVRPPERGDQSHFSHAACSDSAAGTLSSSGIEIGSLLPYPSDAAGQSSVGAATACAATDAGT